MLQNAKIVIRANAGSDRHRVMVVERHPASHDSIDHPDTRAYSKDISEQNTDDGREEHCCNHQPKQGVPECAYLPAEMGVEIRAPHIVSFHVVDDHGDDRRPAGKKCCNDKRRPQHPHQDTETVQ